MIMRAILYNIQGFKGKFIVNLDKPVVNITSELNGTGKTTFFECIKLLCYEGSLDKEELKFVINKECKSGYFKVEDDNIAYGFYYNLEILVYSYEENGNIVETQAYPYEEVQKFLGVMLHGDTFINVCDRFINLFSSSNEQVNYQLVEALTAHKGIADLIHVAEEALSVNKKHLETNVYAYDYNINELNHMLDYPNIDNYEKLLNNDNFIGIHDTLLDVKQNLIQLVPNKLLIKELPVMLLSTLQNSLSEFNPFTNIKYISDSYLIKNLSSLLGEINKFNCIDHVYKTEVLSLLNNLVNNVSLFKCTSTVIETNYLETINSIHDNLNLYHNNINFYDLIIYKKLCNLLSLLIKIKIPYDYISFDEIQKLNHIKNNLYYLRKGNIELHVVSIEIIDIKNQLECYRYHCPLNDEVYLIEGTCYNV